MTNEVSLRKRNKEDGSTESRKTKTKKSTKSDVVVDDDAQTSKESQQNLVDRVRELVDENCDGENDKLLRQKIKDKLSNSISRLGVNININV